MKKRLSAIMAIIIIIICNISVVSAYDAQKRTPHPSPDAPEIVSVTADGSEAVVKWDKSETPEAFYQIMYSQSSSFEADNRTVNITSPNVTAITLDGLSCGTWYFRVRAYEIVDETDRFSKWSATESITIIPATIEITALGLIEGGALISWEKAYPDSCTYQLQIGKDPYLSSPENVYVAKNYATSLDIDWLEPLTYYYFRVRTFGRINGTVYYSKWSDVKSIRTGHDTDDAARQRNAERIWAVCKIMGMTDEQCAGVLGNLTVESNIDPTAVEGIFTEPYQIGPRKTPLFDGNEITQAMEHYTASTLFGIYAANGLGINHPAYRFRDGRFCAGLGLIQFTGPLAQGLFRYANENNKNWYDMDLQIAAVIGGNATCRRRFTQFMADKENANSVYGSTAGWLGIMEIGVEAPSYTGIGFDMRFQHALEWYYKLSPNSFIITKRYMKLAESAVEIVSVSDIPQLME